ncbi:cadherin-like domain-containing protein, partial [Fastidiosibacter lacustris]|uniref:cadherin-like domain-containing protein n=1 Tax=Fastidiosibacter lacustris TaxID=2056695 RepID=UPI00195AC7F7
MVYYNTSDNPAQTVKQIQYVITDANSLDSANNVKSLLTITTVDDAPVVMTPESSMNNGELLTIINSIINISDVDSLASDVAVKVSNVENGYFQLNSNPGVAITEFTLADINNGAIEFVHAGNNRVPSFDVVVGDLTNDVNGALPVHSNFTMFNGLSVIYTNSNDVVDALVPNGSTVQDNSDGTLTVTTQNGSEVTIPQDNHAVITDDGTNVTVDSDGDGILDVTGPSGSNYVNNGDGTFTFTTSDGDSVTLPNNSNAIIGSGDDGETVIDLDGDGTVDVTVPDNSQVIDNGDGTITVITSNGSEVIVPDNSNAVITDDGTNVTVDS